MEPVIDEAKSKATHGVRARFSDAPWFEYLRGRAVFVLGAGGIGRLENF